MDSCICRDIKCRSLLSLPPCRLCRFVSPVFFHVSVSFYLSSQCQKKKQTTGRKVCHISDTVCRRKKVWIVGVEISHCACKSLPHVFKLNTQSRSTISLLPSCLTELCAYMWVCLCVCVCVCCTFSAAGYNNKKIENIFAFSPLRKIH